MKIAIWLSNKGGSPLQVGMERGLKELGHQVEYWRKGRGYDLVILFNQAAHDRDYTYPPFPRDRHIAFIDTAEYGYFKRLPSVRAKYWNTFTEASMGHDTKNRGEQLRLKAHLQGRSFPYFAREFFKDYTFPAGYHPIDYPLYAGSVCNIRPNREEYLKRDLDLFLSWGASHPWRMNLTEELRNAHTKCEISVIGENGFERMPQQLYFQRMRAAKAGVSFDGYGSGSFRMTEILCRSLLLQGPLSIRLPVEFQNGVHCLHYKIEYRETESAGQPWGEFLSTDIIGVLRAALTDPEKSYQMYAAGWDLLMSRYTERAMAAYVLDVVDKHDWKKETAI